MNSITIRPYQEGEASYVSYLQTKYYKQAHQFKDFYEHYILASMAELTARHAGNQLWVAVDGDEVIGSIAIVKVEENIAQLRWFYIDERYQGKGIGKRLMDTAIRFCKEQGYSHIFLWTIHFLAAARHLYKMYGFRPIEEKPNTEWTGELLTEERWDLSL